MSDALHSKGGNHLAMRKCTFAKESNRGLQAIMNPFLVSYDSCKTNFSS